MTLIKYSAGLVAGRSDSGERAVAFLECSDDQDVTAKAVFDSRADKPKRELRKRFDHWIGGGTNDNWFHGFPSHPRYRNCFVFKWKEQRQRHRMYGFLCHPTPKGRPRFQLCVLVIHATKNEHETDTAELDRVLALAEMSSVTSAVSNCCIK